MKRSILLLAIMFGSITDHVYAEVPKVLLVIGLVGVGAIFVDASKTAYDIGMLQGGQRASRRCGIFETAFALPQTLIFAGLARSSSDDNKPLHLAVWTAALTTHGIWTILSADSKADLSMKK